MLCVAFMIRGHGIAVNFAIAFLFISRIMKDVCVLTRFDVANLDCIYVV